MSEPGTYTREKKLSGAVVGRVVSVEWRCVKEDVGDLFILPWFAAKTPLNFQVLFSSLAKPCLKCPGGTMRS
jgi:hypothetical protein